jgi:hypothetical protein
VFPVLLVRQVHQVQAEEVQLFEEALQEFQEMEPPLVKAPLLKLQAQVLLVYFVQ